MLATSTVTQDLVSVFRQLSDLERHATTQEWWMYGRTLPEARRIAEITSLLAAARADLGRLLDTLGHPQSVSISGPGTSELHFAQSFAGDRGWALAHRDEAVSILRLTAQAVPSILTAMSRIRLTHGANSVALAARSQLERVGSRLLEIRPLVSGY